MASHLNKALFFILFTIGSFLIRPSESQLLLQEDFYAKTCPSFPAVVNEVIHEKQRTVPTSGPGTLRLLFHDCMVDGCEGSILISSNHFNKAERDADPNLSLAGDAFDVVHRIKSKLEVNCPGVVSCSDILVQATRDLLVMMGSPPYKVPLGRRDGHVSKPENVIGNLPHSNSSVDEMIKIFEKKGFNIQEMVALTGAHTIGVAQCKEFSQRLFNFSKDSPTDPELNPKLADRLKIMCANYVKEPAMAAFNDVMTPGKFDNMYYKNLPKGLGLLASDNLLVKDPRTKPFVERYGMDQAAFFKDFGAAMEKLGYIGIKTGKDGEIRRRCDAFNDLSV